MPRRQQVVKLKKKTSYALRLRDFRRSDEGSDVPIDRITEQREHVVEAPFSYPSYTLTSKAALPTCPETCKTCAQHYLPGSNGWNPADPRPMIAHSDTEAAQITADYVKSINADRDAIRARLDLDADLLLKRWLRKSVDKRATVVRTAMPDVLARRFQTARLFYEQRRVAKGYWSTLDKKKRSRGFDQYMTEGLQAFKIHNDAHRKQHLLPFIDIESLSQDHMSLLALLHYRSDSDITDWVMHDFEQLRIGFNWTFGPPSFNPHCVIMYGIHFGRLIPWNKQSAHRLDIIGYPRAVLILEAQATLFAFLRKTVEILLEPGLQETVSGHQQWDALVQSDFGKIGPTPLDCRRTEAFRSPPRLDMVAIVECLNEQTDVMFDELWLLQTDPEYFRDHLAQAKNNETHDRLSMEWREQWMLGFALCYSVWADNLRITLKQARYVLMLQEDFESEVRPGRSLPPKYEAVLVLFQRHLEELFQGQVHDLRCLVPQERSFRNHFTLLKDCEPKVNTTVEKLLLSNPMLWNLYQLYNNNPSQSPTFHLAFIDHLMREDAKNEKSRISPLLATHISNMIAVDDIISRLKYHRPQHDPSTDDETLDTLAVSQPRTLPNRLKSAFGRVYGVSEIMWPQLQTFMQLPLPPSDEPVVLLRYLQPLDQASLDFWEMACVHLMLEITGSGHPEKLYSCPMYLTYLGNTEAEQERRALRYARLKQAADEQSKISLFDERVTILTQV